MSIEQTIKPPRSFHDPLFTEERFSSCFLSVQISEWGFSYAVLDGQTQTYIGLGEWKVTEKMDAPVPDQPLSPDIHMARILQSFPWLTRPFKATKVIWEGEKSTLIPEHLFEESAASEILSFNTPVDKSDSVHTDMLTSFRARTIFSMPANALEVIRRTLKIQQTVHHSSVLVSAIAQIYRHQLTKPRVFLHIRDGHFDVVVMDQSSLLFLNSFFFRQPEDLVYFTLFSLDQLGIKPDQTEVTLMGSIQKNTPLFIVVSKYIRKLEFSERNPMYTYSPVFRHVAGHGYFPLLNLNSCGL